MNPDLLAILHAELKVLDDAIAVLSYSYKKCVKIGIKDNYSKEELETYEALSSRFARASDILIQKILRLIDEIDLETPGTIRDRINRAEKKGIVQKADILIDIRNLRNEIAHEYLPEAIKDIFEEVLQFCEPFFKITTKVKDYCKKYNNIRNA